MSTTPTTNGSTTTGTTDLAASVTHALQAIPGVTVTDVSVTGGAVSVEFTDADGHQYEGRVAPGFREVTGEHPSAEFRSITFLEDDGAGVDPAEQVAWLADTAARSVSAMAGVSAWQQVGGGRELPADSAFTVTHEPDGTVTAVLVVGCDGFDAEVTYTRSRGGAAAVEYTMTNDSPYVPPHLRAVVDAGLPAVVAAQAGYTVDGLARQIDAAAQAWAGRLSTPRTNRGMTSSTEPPAPAMVLADLPTGVAVAWHCDQVTSDHPYAEGWVAINIDLAEDGDEPPPWTLSLDPLGAEVDDPMSGFGWAPDLAIHRVVETRPIVPRTVAEAVTAAGGQPGPEESARLRSALTGATRTMMVLPAWSTDAVTAGLNEWAARVLLRADLRFHWDGGTGISPLGAWAQEQTRLAATRPQYESGVPGVTLSEVMMDNLLAMGPEGAADVMDFVRGIAEDPC